MNEYFFQDQLNRQYVHANIKLRLVTVDLLKGWNQNDSSVERDIKFIKWLLVDIFGCKILRVSDLHRLDAEKIRFIRGPFEIIVIIDNL